MIPFQNTYSRLPATFFSRQAPAKPPHPQARCINHKLGHELRIDAAWLQSADAVDVFSGVTVAAGSEPIAQAYAGHQFGHFVPQLGDGRALLLGEVIDQTGQRRDIALKGSGRTAFSRGGDGKCALGPALREYLVSEAMYALGVPTCRSLAVVTTGEKVMRDEALPGAIITRVASSHLRVGTFEYFAALEDIASLRVLTDYAISRHGGGSALGLLKQTIARQASLVAHWMSLGFIHGVMNTDNCTISGDTLDYGPCAFMDAFHPNCVFSAIDRYGRYAWAKQAEIAQWNMARLAEAMLPVLSQEGENAPIMINEALAEFAPAFHSQFQQRFAYKLGLEQETLTENFLTSTLRLMARDASDFTIFFSKLTAIAKGEDHSQLLDLFQDHTAAKTWLDQWLELKPSAIMMDKANPKMIPRNHLVEQAIQAAYRDDYSTFHRLLDAWANPWDTLPEHDWLTAAPMPHEVVRQTFCGT